MNIIRARIRHIAQALGTHRLQIQRQLRHVVRNWGIGLRLGISFGAVAILAISANLIVEHGTSVIQTTRILDLSPIVREMSGVLSAVPKSVFRPTAAPDPSLMTHLEDSNLQDALGQFDRMLVLRAQTATAENKALLSTADQHFAREVSRITSNATSTAAAGTLKSFASQVKALRAAGDSLIAASDARRAAFASYWNHFDGVDRLIKSAFDQNWTIFGRVIARQSLISLSRQLDDLRRQAAQLTAAGGYESSTLSALAESEAKLSNTIEQNATGLTRSQGARWVGPLRNELSAVISSGTELATADRQATVAFGVFEQNVRSAGMLARKAAEPLGPQIPMIQITAFPVDLALSRSAHAQTVSIPVPPLSTRIYRQTTSTDFSNLARTIIAALSGIVLLLLLAISITTVRSIVLPIRQFMATTARLARGDAAARFERGGIREIDSLAVSLNEMASTLETARAIALEYQGALEVRIEERTRRLQHLAEHDLLTGLPNRRLLQKRLETALLQAAATNVRVAVFFLDLDNFKNLNDTMGHTFGDRVLQAVAQRLALLAAPSRFVGRLGGDEFTILDFQSESVEKITEHGTELVKAFQSPLLVEGRELLISMSVGVSLYPEHESSTEALLSAADAALFHAKRLGRNQLNVFRHELFKTASERFNTEQGLRRALERDEFQLVFQPEVNFARGGVKLMEALLRWRLPDGRRLSPMQFLPTAQECGLIMSIGDWVLRSAIETAAQWHHGSWANARIAINVSASQLLSQGFAQRVQQLLLQYKLPPQCIEIELTETVLQTGPTTIDTLRELRALGLAVALDDFGTGFSSLASLQHLPLTRVKLDQSLIAAIDRDQRALAITSAIVSLCEKLGLEVTAEGIERPEQLHLLIEHRLMCLQGYLISYPIESDAVVAAVANMPEHLQSLFLATSATMASRAAPIRASAGEDAPLPFEFPASKQA